MLNWLIYGMVYLGSALMVYNIYGFVQFARYVKSMKGWDRGNGMLYLPIALLVCFLLGYLAVGIFGKPDLIVSGILFGGSIFVFVMYRLLSGITQRIVEGEQVEAKLMAAEESSRAKTEFLASMSHEMRTPMNAIIGLGGIVMQDESLRPQTRERIEQIDASARYLLDMINDVLDMNNIESNDMKLDEAPFSLTDTVELVKILAQTKCREKGLEYRHEVADDLPQTCVGDVQRIRQILMNVIDNAVKFTPTGGTVSFIARQEAAEEGRCALRFTIRDTGVGIDEAFLPNLFEPFMQEESGMTTRYGGSGLGLAITKKLVDMMGGDIAVTSEKGKGSRFDIALNLAVPASEAGEGAAEAEQERVSLAGRRVLIAEDIDLNADLLADLLDLEDIASERAVDGRNAVAMFDQRPAGYYDAILMDLRMPVMDGFEATRAIRAMDREDAKRIPIIAVTANAFEEDVRQSLEAGMNAHIAKPADIELLIRTLEEYIVPNAGG